MTESVYIYNDEDNAPMNESAVEVKKFYCCFRAICPVKGCTTDRRDECGWYDRFLDRELDAQDITREQAKGVKD